MIDPHEVQIVVMAYREEPNRHLAAWLRTLEGRGYDWRYGPETHPVYVARNQVVHRFLTEDIAKQHLVMIDAPLVPIAGGTVHVLTDPGEVVYCGYFGRYGTAGHHLDFGCGCFRASRQVYESMPPPWFDFGYDETLTQKTQCECAHFAQRLSSLSLDERPVVPIQVGIIGRLTELVLIPSGHGHMRIVSPHELSLGDVWSRTCWIDATGILLHPGSVSPPKSPTPSAPPASVPTSAPGPAHDVLPIVRNMRDC